MEQKSKFVIIGLIGALVVVFVLLIGTMGQKQDLMKQREELQSQNTSLLAKVKNLENSLNDSRSKISLLQSDLDDIVQEKSDLERRYELASKAQQDLMDRLKSLQSGGVQQPQMQFLPGQTDAYWAGILKAKTDLELQNGNLSSQLRSTQILNEQLQREKSSLELELSNIRREKEDVKRELEYNKKILDSISQELVRERNDKIQVQDSFKAIKSENTVLSRQLDSLNNRKISLEKRVQELQEERDTIDRRFNELQTMLTDRISQINGLREELDAIRRGAATGELSSMMPSKAVELPPIVVRPQGESASRNLGVPYEGRVLSVVKDNNFVVVDLGAERGVRVGDTFQVFRGDKAIASIEAMQVRTNISACDIKKQDMPISVGDTVK